MKKITQFGFIAFASIMLFATACKKSPSAKLYNTWSLEDVNMPGADSVTLAKVDAEGVTYTFSKDGKYSVSGAFTAAGTFEINEEGTNMSTTEDGNTSMYNVQLTESMLKLTSGEESMTFTVKK